MTISILFAAAVAMHVTPLAAPDTQVQIPIERRIAADAISTDTALPTAPSPMDVLPVAGLANKDYAIPFFVDLDNGPGIRDFNCGRMTFDTHTGHDPYIRSFREQQIGVPVFAVRDGVVLDVRDGEPDENTDNTDPSLRANYVYLRHGTDERSQYVHLKRNSITVKVGDFVPAGTQIGMVGSSGPSRAPHIHFETTVDGQAAEPLAGPCRAGLSALPHQEQQVITDRPIAFGATFSKEPFDKFRNAPFDDAPHTGTYVIGRRTMYFKAELANVHASTRYSIKLDRPGSRTDVTAATGTLVNYDASLVSVWWAMDVDLDRPGAWALILNADGEELLNAPFTVVTSSSQDVNRPPRAFNVSFEAPVVLPGRVPVCRVDGPTFADPDYDVLTYRYRWSVDNQVVRDITSAARTDALARNLVRADTTLTCSVTASDGKVETQPVSTFASIETGRRRAIRK
ncbi:MAG: peptidoglycan DD-metalloendopeptidase family protein [Thermoanaerobaculia bacterium]